MAVLPTKKVAGVQAGALLRTAPSDVLVSCIAGLIERGHALTFSATRDQSTLCVTLLDNGAKERVYFGSAEELGTFLEAVYLEYGELAETPVVEARPVKLAKR